MVPRGARVVVAAVLSKATSVTRRPALLVLNLYPLRRIGGPLATVAFARRVISSFCRSGAFRGRRVVSVVALHPPRS
jgi:hypothetical protein